MEMWRHHGHIDGLMQDCSNSIAKALELLQSCIKSSISLSHDGGSAWYNA